MSNVRTKDMGEVGDMLGNLVVELKGFNFSPEEKRGLKGLFKRATNHIAALKAQYEKAEANVDKIVEMLEQHQITLLKDVALLDKMYKLNQTYFRARHDTRGKGSSGAKQRAVALQKRRRMGCLEDAERFCQHVQSLEKKIHDLELTG